MSNNPREEKTTEEEKTTVLGEIISWIKVLAFAVLTALFITRFIIANSTVPTGSMENTIMQGDRVIGSRLSYKFGDLERGDVVIFDFGWMCGSCKHAQGEGETPDACPACGATGLSLKTMYYLKRTIGLPGDKVEIKMEGSVGQDEVDISMGGPGGTEGSAAAANLKLATAAVYINGEKLEEPYLKEPMLYTGDMEFEVPEGCYFFLGDNRNNSLDARYWHNPYISKDKIIAKVLFRYFPKPSVIR